MKRLEVTFSAGGISCKGILSNVSANGLFIRTNRGFIPGTIVDIQLMMPGNLISSLRGIVKRTVKVPVTPSRNGMGIELITRDEPFINFVKTFLAEQGVSQEEQLVTEPPLEFHIIACNGCGVKNKVSREQFSGEPQCGKCGTQLITGVR